MDFTEDIITKESIEFLGVGTARYCNVVELDEKHVMFPLNSELHIWSFDTRLPLPSEDLKEEAKDVPAFDGRLEFKQSVVAANIPVLLQSDSTWVGATYDGEVIVWKKETVEELIKKQTFTEIAKIQTGKWSIRHAAVSKDGSTIAIVAEETPDHAIFIISMKDNELKVIQEISEIPMSKIRQCEFNANGELLVVSANYEVEVKNGREGKSNLTHTVGKYSFNGESFELNEKIQIEDSSYLLHIKQTDDHALACGLFQSRQVVIINSNTGTIIHQSKIDGVGSLSCEIIDNMTKSFIVPCTKTTALKYTATSPDLISQSSIALNFELATSMYNSALLSPSLLITFCESGINSYNFNQTENLDDSTISTWTSLAAFDKNLIHVSGGGIDINRKGDLVCFGDFSGRVHVYTRKMDEVKKKMVFVREKPFKFQHSVRSMAFHPMLDNVVMVGLTSGWIFYVDPIADIVADIGGIDDTVTTLKFYQNVSGMNCEYVLIAGSTNGNTKFFYQSSDSPTSFIEIHCLHAHPKSSEPQDINFGSLTKYSEVWNLTPQNYSLSHSKLTYFITCSEDQTGKIWRINTDGDLFNASKDFECEGIDTLKGHKKAVTDVAWFKMKESVLGEGGGDDQVVASCSDDQTVRIYRVRIREGEEIELEFLYDLSTSFIKDWHTITYMALEENGDRVAVVTQNGLLVVWRLDNELGPERIYARKIHTGGVEGLKWKQGKILTVSSDCTAALIHLPQAQESEILNPDSKAFAFIK